MAGILFLIAWIIIPFVWVYILKLGGMRLMVISLPSFVVFSIFVFQYVGFPILYFGLDAYRAEFVTDENLILKAWLITSIATILICFGALLGANLLRPLKYFKSANGSPKLATSTPMSLSLVLMSKPWNDFAVPVRLDATMSAIS